MQQIKAVSAGGSRRKGGCWGCWHCTQPLNVGCKDQLLSNSPSLRAVILQSDSCTDVYKEKVGGTGVPADRLRFYVQRCVVFVFLLEMQKTLEVSQSFRDAFLWEPLMINLESVKTGPALAGRQSLFPNELLASLPLI